MALVIETRKLPETEDYYETLRARAGDGSGVEAFCPVDPKLTILAQHSAAADLWLKANGTPKGLTWAAFGETSSGYVFIPLGELGE